MKHLKPTITHITDGLIRNQIIDPAHAGNEFFNLPDEPEIRKWLSTALYNFVHVHKKGAGWDEKTARSLLAQTKNLSSGSIAKQFICYVNTLISLAKNMEIAADSDIDHGKLLDIVNEYRDTYEADGVYDLFEGKIKSFYARDEAADIFKQLVAGDSLVKDISFERGIRTYFKDTDILPTEPPPLPDLPVPEKATVMWSADERFMRAYGPYWLSIAPALADKGFNFMFLVVGDSDAAAFTRDMAAYRGIEDCVTVCEVPLPATVPEPTTYYACARFIYAETVLRLTGRPLITADMDMTLTKPLDKTIEQLTSDFSVPASRGFARLSPWRRYMAGSALFRPSSQPSAALLRDYIMRGLREKNSWTLDQNAMAYVVEKNASSFRNFSDAGRPFEVFNLGKLENLVPKRERAA